MDRIDDPDQTHRAQEHRHEERGAPCTAVADVEAHSLDLLDDPGGGIAGFQLDHRRMEALGGACGTEFGIEPSDESEGHGDAEGDGGIGETHQSDAVANHPPS